MASSGRAHPEGNVLDFNPFKVLGVTASTTDEELKKIFHKKMGGLRALTTRINQAYDLLKDADPERRLELERAYSGEAPEQSTSSIAEKEDEHVLSMAIQEPPIFPSLIWDMILGMLEDPQDVSNAVTAIPELAPLVRKKAHLLRFGEVLPHLLPWLKREDVLSSRLVCRRWSSSLDQFLESYLNPCAPLPQTLVDELDDDFFPGVRMFWSSGEITQFLHDMRNHPAQRNPFVGRQVCLNPDGPGVLTAAYMRQFWEEAENLFRKFGHHVWFLEICTQQMEENPGVYTRSVLNCFRYLPNLKCFFSYMGYPINFVDNPGTRSFRNGAMEAVNNFIGLGVPPPAQLEAILLPSDRFPSSLVNFLVSWSSPHLRQLSLGREGMGRGFPKVALPNLNELTIEDSTPRRVLRDLLRNLETPKLTKLELNLGHPRTTYEMEVDIFPFLKKFPNLECLTLQTRGSSTCICEKGTLTPATDSIPSLKSLTIASNNGQLVYNFLLCFPGLELLEIDCKYNLDMRSGPIRPHPTLRLEEFLLDGRLYESNVWELLPKLKRITLKSSKLTRGFPVGACFSRSAE